MILVYYVQRPCHCNIENDSDHEGKDAGTHHGVVVHDGANGVLCDALKHHEVGKDGCEEDDPITDTCNDRERSLVHDLVLFLYRDDGLIVQE